MLTDKEKSEITNTLIQKIKFFECPMCHSHNFTIVDGYISQYLQAKINSIKLEGSILPSIAIVCTNCGFTAYHNIGILGVLSNLNIKLSDIDIERLKTWVNGSGTFSFTRHLGNNVQYIFSNKSYTANGNKEISEWNMFFEKLLKYGFIEITDYDKKNGPIYKLTEKAYDYVNNLKK